MSLNIYTDRKFVPSDMEIIDISDTYFNVFTNLLDDEFVNTVLREIDKAKYNSELTYISRVPEVGALNKITLSTGTKTLLNIVSHPDMCFNVVECGDNALRLLAKITEGNILWEDPFLIYAEYKDCDILVNGKNRYTDFTEFLDSFEDEEDN